MVSESAIQKFRPALRGTSYCPGEPGYDAARAIPNARLVVYETGGHLLVGREAEVREAIHAFLADAGLASLSDAAVSR